MPESTERELSAEDIEAGARVAFEGIAQRVNNEYAGALRRLILAFDADDKMPFLAALRAGRRLLHLRIEDRADREERAVLAANGIEDK